MNSKKYYFIGAIVIFLLCFPFHFLYELMPNTFFSFLFPVNESIWEHMKLLFTPFILYNTFKYLMLKRKENNFWMQQFIVPVIGIILYLLIYIPIYNIIGENMFINITLLAIIIIIQQFITYKLASIEKIKYQKTIGIIGLSIVFLTFAYLTYYPFKTELFYDTNNQIYGIKPSTN